MPAKSPYTIEIANQQSRHRIPRQQFKSAVHLVLQGEGIPSATISLAVVDDPAMHQLNRQYLQHDYPTDVLSFVLDRTDESLEGEIVISADTAASSCSDYGWSVDDEMTLYVVHGLLHLVGFDDHSPADRRRMRSKEKEYLEQLRIHGDRNTDFTKKKKPRKIRKRS